MRFRKAFITLSVVALLIVGLIVAPSTSREYQAELVDNPVDYVDTMIGTGTGGETVGEINNFPGPSVPFGMVQYSPDTANTYAGYEHSRDDLTGFSMTHASVGCAAFGDISMLPTTSEIGSQPWDATEKISHDRTEVGVPGYYTVRFPDTKVTAELTATTRVGVGRFHYPRNDKAAMFHVRAVSLAGNSLASLQIGEDNQSVTGWATSGGFCGRSNSYTVYFAMKFSQPFDDYGTWDGYSVFPRVRSTQSTSTEVSGGYLQFPAGSTVEVRTALSYVSIDGARANLAAEGNTGFDAVRSAASSEWNAVLSRIRVAGVVDDDITTFYTAVYHSLLHPNTFNDINGRYLGFDDRVHTLATGHAQYANYSDWDTYRSLAALQAMLMPKAASDIAQSLVNDAEQSGALPRWALANVSTGMMTGDNAVPLIASLYAFGAKDFDTGSALRYMVSGATTGGVGLGGYVERPGIAEYLKRGYLPQTVVWCGGTDSASPSASITLEWSVDDFAIGRFAEALGQTATAEQFRDRSQNWQNLFNPSTKSISPRSVAGYFANGPAYVRPDPECFGQVGYDEGNAEQYVWWVPQNIAGLTTALGGRKAAVERLDKFTSKLNVGPNEPYLWAGNEPNFGVPWLYNYLGQPWKTQRLVDEIRSSLFGPHPDGAPGNDDLGAQASWYVWASLGLYPVIPGTSVLTVNAPLFDRAEIKLAGGDPIKISAPGASGRHRLRYIRSLSVDGRQTERTWVPESLVHTGGELSYVLVDKPDTSWCTDEAAAPPSFREGESAVTVNISPTIVGISPESSGVVMLDAQRMIDGPEGYTITGTADDPGITVAPVSGRFGDDGSAGQRVEIAVGKAVPPGYHPLVLTTTVDRDSRPFQIIVSIGAPEIGSGPP